MADEKRTILLSVELNTAQLEKAAKAASDKLFDLRGEAAKAAVQHGKDSVEYKKLALEIQKYNKELTNNVKAIQASEARQIANTGSLVEMRKALADAVIVYGNLDQAQRESAQGQEMVQAMHELKMSINEVEQSYGTFTGSVGNYEEAQKPLRAQLRAVIQEMQAMHAAGQEDSETFKELSARAGQLRDSMDAVNEQVKTLATGTKLEAGLNVMKGGFDAVIGSAQAAEGAMQLFGDENEAVTEGIQKMVALQSISNGVNELYNSLKKEGALVTALFTAQTKVKNVTMAISNKLFGEGTKLANGFSKALMLTGIGALIAGLAALVENWDSIKSALSGVSEEQAVLNEHLDDYKAGAAEAITKTNQVQAAFELAEKGVISKEEALQTYNDTLGDSFGEMTNLNDAEATFIKKKDAFIQATAQRALATALFAKAAEEQANAITAGMENQISTTDLVLESTFSLFESQETIVKRAKRLQAEGVKDAQDTAMKRFKLLIDEGMRQLELAETTENANGITSESENKLNDDRKKRADEQKKRQEEALKQAEELAKRMIELSTLEQSITLSDERKILEAHYQFLETIAEDNATALLDLQAKKNADLRALELKELEASEKAITDKYAAEITAAGENAELVTALEKAKQAELNSIRLDSNNQFVQREIAFIAKQEQLDAERLANEKTVAEEVKLLALELALEKVKGSELEFTAWKALQDERIAQLQRYRDAEIAIETKTATEKEKIETATALQIEQIKNESFEQEKARDEKSIADKAALAQFSLSAAQQFAGALTQIISNRLQEELNLLTSGYNSQATLLQQQLDASLITQAEFNAQKSELDAEFKAKEKKLKIQQFKRDQSAALIQAGITLSQAVLNALATPPAPNIPLSILAGVLGGIQIAAIASAPTPQFSKGGQVKSGTFGGNLHGQGGTKGIFSDGTRVEVERDEAFFILNRRATAAIANLSNHNVKHGGAPFFANGGVLKFQGGGAFAASQSNGTVQRFNDQNAIIELVRSLPTPIVPVESIIDATGRQLRIENAANF